MDKIKNTLKVLGAAIESNLEHHKKIADMQQELARRGHNLDLATTKQIAGILVNRAEVTWKN